MMGPPRRQRPVPSSRPCPDYRDWQQAPGSSLKWRLGSPRPKFGSFCVCPKSEQLRLTPCGTMELANYDLTSVQTARILWMGRQNSVQGSLRLEAQNTTVAFLVLRLLFKAPVLRSKEETMKDASVLVLFLFCITNCSLACTSSGIWLPNFTCSEICSLLISMLWFSRPFKCRSKDSIELWRYFISRPFVAPRRRAWKSFSELLLHSQQ